MLKIGNRLINLNAIAHIELNAKRTRGYSNPVTEEGVRITMLSNDRQDVGTAENPGCVTVAETLFFTDEEADALRWFFTRLAKNTELIEEYRALSTWFATK